MKKRSKRTKPSKKKFKAKVARIARATIYKMSNPKQQEYNNSVFFQGSNIGLSTFQSLLGNIQEGIDDFQNTNTTGFPGTTIPVFQGRIGNKISARFARVKVLITKESPAGGGATTWPPTPNPVGANNSYDRMRICIVQPANNVAVNEVVTYLGTINNYQWQWDPRLVSVLKDKMFVLSETWGPPAGAHQFNFKKRMHNRQLQYEDATTGNPANYNLWIVFIGGIADTDYVHVEMNYKFTYKDV